MTRVSAAYETLLYEQSDDGVVQLTLNRPDSLNAMNRRLVDDLHACFDDLASSSVRVVVLRGAGRAFCAGLDLKEPPTGSSDPADILSRQRHISSLIAKVHHLPQVFIACVHGAAAGGGFALALASDIRLAGESAKMNAAFIRIGLSACDVGVSYFLPRAVGASVASELLLTGDFIDAKRAVATGLVSAVVPDAELAEAGHDMAARVVRNTPLGVRLTKECLRHSIDAGSLDAAIAMEDRNQALAVSSGDFMEGMRAFVEKRPPRYRT